MDEITRIWRFLRSNPIINSLYITVIILGILMISLVIAVGWSTDSDTERVEGNTIGHGFGRDLRPGDVIEIHYSIEGEDVDALIVRGYTLPFNDDEENVLVVRHNVRSGIMRYVVEEDGLHMVYFRGSDFTVSYTYRVDKPWFTVFIIIIGQVLIAIGIVGMWHFSHLTIPKYYGEGMKYNFMIFTPLGIGMTIFVLAMGSAVHLFSSILMVIFGVEGHLLGKALNRHYYLRAKLRPNEAVELIKRALDIRGMKYRQRSSVREYLLKWNTVFDIEREDIKIKVKEQRYQEWRTMMAIGRQNVLNREVVIGLANDIALSLGCEDFVPVQVSHRKTR